MSNTTEGNSVEQTKKSSDQLSEDETKWLYHECGRALESGIAELSAVNNGVAEWKSHITKKSWIADKYYALNSLGYITQTIFRLIHETVERHKMPISEGYIRKIIQIHSHYDLPKESKYVGVNFIIPTKAKEAYAKRNVPQNNERRREFELLTQIEKLQRQLEQSSTVRVKLDKLDLEEIARLAKANTNGSVDIVIDVKSGYVTCVK